MTAMSRSLAKLSLLAFLLLVPAVAQAQFANRSVSLSVGYMDLNEAVGLTSGFPLGLAYTGYIESGFEWTVGVQGMILRDLTGRQVVAVAGGPGLRYLFLEEALRPYVGAELTYLHIFALETAASFVGLGPYGGVDYFVTDSFSAGVRAQYNLYVMLNQPVQTSLGASVVLSAWF
jgi:outer membrane protein